MKKLLFLLIFAVVASGCGNDDDADSNRSPGLPELPDPNDVCSCMDDRIFRKYCYDNFDIDDDDKISRAEAELVTAIDLTESDVRSIRGICYFSGLRKLTCRKCELLESADLSDNRKILSIGELDFQYCSPLTSIVIPEEVTSIEDHAFHGCDNLTAFYGKYASDDRRCLVRDGELIAFARKGLTRYAIPNSVISVGNSVFLGCDALRSIKIPDSVTSIQDFAFSLCIGLATVDMPNGLSAIEEGAFFNCKSLTGIDIPAGVTSVGARAFFGCSALTRIFCKPNIPPSLGDMAFRDVNDVARFYVPAASVDSYKAAQGWSYYTDRIYGYDFE